MCLVYFGNWIQLVFVGSLFFSCLRGHIGHENYIYIVIQSDRRWTWWIWGNLNINIVAMCCIFVRTPQQQNSTNSTKPRNIIPLNPGIPSQLVTLKADRSRPTGPCRNLQNMGNVELEIVGVCCVTSKTVDLEIHRNSMQLCNSTAVLGWQRLPQVMGNQLTELPEEAQRWLDDRWLVLFQDG